MNVHNGTAEIPSVLQRTRRPSRRSVLDVAAEVLVAEPGASLGAVAEAAGIGRTTLHKQFATRDDLLRAVAHRALDLWAEAIAGVTGATDADDGLRSLIAAMIPIGPQLAFLRRNPSLDHDDEIGSRWRTLEPQALAVLGRAREAGVLARQVPDWWLLGSLYSLVHAAAESVQAGLLAPLSAPDLVLDTLVRGLGARARFPEYRHE